MVNLTAALFVAMASPPSIAWRGAVPLCDIAVNLTDGMFRGMYRGKRKHEDDLQLVLSRAREAGVSRMIVTGTFLEEAKEALALAREGDGLFCTCGVHPTRCNAFVEHPGGPDAYYAAVRDIIRDGVTDGKVCPRSGAIRSRCDARGRRAGSRCRRVRPRLRPDAVLRRGHAEAVL